MQIKRSQLWARTVLIMLCAVLLLIWAGSVTESPSIVLLSWISAPLLGLLTAHMWLTYGMLPPAPAACRPVRSRPCARRALKISLTLW